MRTLVVLLLLVLASSVRAVPAADKGIEPESRVVEFVVVEQPEERWQFSPAGCYGTRNGGWRWWPAGCYRRDPVTYQWILLGFGVITEELLPKP